MRARILARAASTALALLLWAGGVCMGQGAFQNSPPDITDAVLSSDLVGRYFDVLPTTTLLVADVQTPPWSVTATVVTVSVPIGADTVDPSAVEFREVGTGSWVTGGAVVKQAWDSGESFDVQYRIDLHALGNGAVGTYAFDVTYRFEVGGSELDAVVVRLSVTAGVVVSLSLSGGIDDLQVNGASLAQRYVALGGDLDVAVLALTSFRVTVSCSVNGAADTPGVLVLSSTDVQVVSNPSGGEIALHAGLSHAPVRDAPWVFAQSFTGTNAAGQPTVVQVGFAIDLDAIGDAASGTSKAIVATFTVTEE